MAGHLSPGSRGHQGATELYWKAHRPLAPRPLRDQWMVIAASGAPSIGTRSDKISSRLA
jgi:hypothetical protein